MERRRGLKLTNRFTFKLLTLVIGTYMVSMATLFIIAEQQLNKIIDKSQTSIFEEKMDIILGELQRQHRRLQNTGFVEAYEKDFKERILNQFSESYYNGDMSGTYPFILDGSLNIILHPDLPAGEDSQKVLTIPPGLSDSESGSFTAEFNSEEKWYMYKQFEPWDWMIMYAIPVVEKYRDVITFRRILLLLMTGLTMVSTLALVILMMNFTKPILFLTETARNIAKGDLEQPINMTSRDEIGSLARSFKEMQASVKQKIEDLNLEIDERQKVEKELSRARNLIAGIIESMPSAMIAVDSGGLVTQWNGQAVLLSGVSSAEALGAPVLKGFPGLEPEMPLIHKAMESEAPQFILQKEIQTESGTSYNDITIYPLTGQGLEGAVIRIDDVTEKKQVEEQLSQSRRMDAIGQLAGGVAHDFNNMLAGITGAASLLQSSTWIDDPEDRKFIQMILDASDRASELTEKLLTFSRKQAKSFTVFSLHEVINSSLELLERTIDKKVRIHFEPNAQNELLKGRFFSIQNALMNLVINASHAMPEGGLVHITTENTVMNDTDCLHSPFSLVPGQYIKITISDTGIGIAPENLEKIFEPFFTTKKHGQGSGLGLASVYGIMQNHNGAVTVDSVPGEGTTFILYFPCTDESRQQKESRNEQDLKGHGKILLIDDEAIVRDTVEVLLKQMGYDTLCAEDGRKGLEIYRAQADQIDLVISDMIMPGLSGRDVFYRIKEINRSCPVIISSGFTKDENLEQLKNDGLAGFLQKPFRRDELNRMISEILKSEFRE
jgi:PAS domain S-box-containing protein